MQVIRRTSLDGRPRVGLIPHPGIFVCNLWPHQPKAILNRVDLIGQWPEHNELVRDDSAGGIFPSERVRKAQRYLLIDATTGFRLIRDAREKARS